MTLEEILQDIHGLDTRLQELESQYGVLSEDVHALYRLGEWEQNRDLIRWIGYYDLRQERLRAYETALFDRPNLPMLIEQVELRLRSSD